MRQLITPTPDIPCTAGWCLQYVRQAYGLPARYGSATEAWDNSTSQHTGRDFPPGLWTPVWYAVAGEPLGHVVLLAPDGSVYSTSDLTTTPHHHPDLTDLENYYAYYGMALTYRGWTEDVAGYPVLDTSAPALAPESSTTTTTLEGDAMSAADVDAIVAETNKQKEDLKAQLFDHIDAATLNLRQNILDTATVDRQYLTDRIKDTAPADLAAQINAAGIAADVRNELVKLIGG